MKNNDQNHNDSYVEGTTRRDFLLNSAYAAAGAATVGLVAGNARVKEAYAADKAAAGKSAGGLNLITPTYEESPTYLATYPASDRAKKQSSSTAYTPLFIPCSGRTTTSSNP